MTDTTRRRITKTNLVTNWNGNSAASVDVFANQGISQHQLVVYASGVPAVGVLKVEVRAMGSNFWVPIGTLDLTRNGTGTMIFCALLDGVRLSFPGGISAGMSIGADIYSTGLFFTVGDDYLQNTERRRVPRTVISNGWNGSGSVTMTCPEHGPLTQHQLAIAGGTGLVELKGRPTGGTQFVTIDVQCEQIDTSGMLVIFAGMYDAFQLVPQGTVTGSVQAQICSVGELLFFNNVAQGTYGDGTHVPVITVNGGGQITSITVVPINFPVTSVNGHTGAVVLTASDIDTSLGYTPIGQFNGRAGTGSPPNITLLASDVNTALGYVPANPTTFMSSYKNQLINGRFDLWQRSQNGATLANVNSANNQYVADRWKTQLGGDTVVVSQQAFTIGQTAVPDNPKYFARCTVTSVAGAGNYAIFTQSVENVYTLSGNKAAFSFWAKADANRNVAVEITQYFGTGGSPSAFVSIPCGLFALTTSWQYFFVIVNIPSVAGTTLGTSGTDAVQVSFWMDAGSSFNARASNLGQQSGVFDFCTTQFEKAQIGTSGNYEPTPYELRPIVAEVALAERFFQKSYNLTQAPGTAVVVGNQVNYNQFVGVASNAITIRGNFSQTMRANPTFTTYDDAGNAGKCSYYTGTWNNNGTVTFTPVSSTGYLAFFGGLANTITAIEYNYAADAEI